MYISRIFINHLTFFEGHYTNKDLQEVQWRVTQTFRRIPPSQDPSTLWAKANDLCLVNGDLARCNDQVIMRNDEGALGIASIREILSPRHGDFSTNYIHTVLLQQLEVGDAVVPYQMPRLKFTSNYVIAKPDVSFSINTIVFVLLNIE